MKTLLFIGDVVGNSGSSFLVSKLSLIKRQYGVDITIVNGENSAAGDGITPSSADALIRAGTDIITTGNHAFKRKEASVLFDREYILRPANYPEGGAPGKGYFTMDMGTYSVAIINLMGTVFMEPLDNPFTKIDELLKKIETPNIFVDFHAEATSEKKAMGHYLTGRVSGVLGTHTHVQTADEIILGRHTAYITDVGMTGPEISSLGADIKPAIDRFRFHTPVRFKEADSDCFLCGVCVEFDEKCGKSHKIERLIIR